MKSEFNSRLLRSRREVNELRLRMTIQHYLQHDEDLIWSGYPKQGVIFRKSDIMFIPISLAWGAFLFFILLPDWRVEDFFSPKNLFFSIMLLILIVACFIVIIGRFFLDAKFRANSEYGITSKRILIVSGIFRKKLKIIAWDAVNELHLKTFKNGIGTIYFGPKTHWIIYGNRSWFTHEKITPRLDFISNPHEVFETIKGLTKK